MEGHEKYVLRAFLSIYHYHTSLHISYTIRKKKEVAFPAQQKSWLGYATAAFHTSFRVKSQKGDTKKEKKKKKKNFYYPLPGVMPD